MFRFLRSFRYKLTTNKYLSRYVIYAIGEIMLVVIGILLALQIDNWNEKKKNRAFEKEVLEQIQSNLSNDRKNLAHIQNRFAKAIASSNKILDHNWNENPNDSLKYWVGDVLIFSRFQPLTNAYEVIKSKGFEHISNKELRFLLGAYYDESTKNVVKGLEDVEDIFHTFWVDLISREGVDVRFMRYIILNDYEIFRRPTREKNILKINRDNLNGGIRISERAIRIIDTIQKIIAKDIK